MSRRSNRPNGRVIWIAKDQSGIYAYNHQPKVCKDECEYCGGGVNNFRGTPEKDCWELCDAVLAVLGIPKLEHGQIVRYELVKSR